MKNDPSKNWGSMASLVAEYKAAAERDAKFANRRTGFKNLDPVEGCDPIQVFSPGLYILGAPPSAGKSTFGLQLLSQLSDRGEDCLFISYEQSPCSLLRKLISRRLFEKEKAGEKVLALTASGIRYKGLTDEVSVVLDELPKTMSHLHILRGEWAAEDLVSMLEKFAADFPRPTICIDYLQLVPAKKSSVTPRERIDDLLGKLRAFQVKTDSTLIVVASLNRASYGDDRLGVFKESGTIEYSGDVVWLLLPANDKTDFDELRRQKIRGMKLRCIKSREGGLYETFFRYHAPHDCFEPCKKEDLVDDDDDKPSKR